MQGEGVENSKEKQFWKLCPVKIQGFVYMM